MNSKTKNIVVWVIAGLLATFFIFMRIEKLTGDPATAANFEG